MHEQSEAVGIGLHIYHDVNGELPAGNANYFNYTWEESVGASIHLLPFMEQGNLHERFTADAKAAAAGAAPWDSSTLRSTGTINAFICPSAPDSAPIFNGISKNHYVYSAGDGLWHNYRNDEQEGNANAKVDSRGMFCRNKGRNFAFCTDGTSNTLAMSEVVGTSDKASVLGGVTTFSGIYTGGNSTPGPCLTAPVTADGRSLPRSTRHGAASFWEMGVPSVIGSLLPCRRTLSHVPILVTTLPVDHSPLPVSTQLACWDFCWMVPFDSLPKRSTRAT